MCFCAMDPPNAVTVLKGFPYFYFIFFFKFCQGGQSRVSLVLGGIFLTIRPYRPEDCRALTQLFYETVHTVNARDYTPAQLDAWADGRPDLAAWDRSLRAHYTLVAVENGEPVGFGDIDAAAKYLDRLYVHREFQGQGIANALCRELEKNDAEIQRFLSRT